MRELIPTNRDLKFGVVIATHAAECYVELGLACLTRHEPHVKVMVHDDDSIQKLRLRLLAEKYGADFVSTDYRKTIAVGDMSAFAEGLKWGDNNGLDVVVKVSRRFILNRPWSRPLEDVFQCRQCVTATGCCSWLGWGYRSEIVAMHVPTWIACGNQAHMAEVVRRNEQYASLPEAYYHDLTKKAYEYAHPRNVELSHADNVNHPDCDMVLQTERHWPRHRGCTGFDDWPMLGLARTQKIRNCLWHDSHKPEDYYYLSKEYGLPYSQANFVIVPGE